MGNVTNPDGTPGYDDLTQASMSSRPNPVTLVNFVLSQLQRVLGYHRIHSYKWNSEDEMKATVGASNGDYGFRNDTLDSYKLINSAWILQTGIVGSMSRTETNPRIGQANVDSELVWVEGPIPRGSVSIFGTATFKAYDSAGGGDMKILIDGNPVQVRRWDAISDNSPLSISIYAEENIAAGNHKFQLITTHDATSSNIGLHDCFITVNARGV